MQNRGTFPYRRQGGKKRRNGGGPRKVRGPQKPLPNSVRDLLPLLQPATKALAQVLAGRAGPSGQLAHAQAVATHADRLVAERAHNRLNPGEREEFFEQLARLKLTITDAEAEAREQEVEEPDARPAPPPVGKERLREMALALSAPSAPAGRNGATAEVGEAADEAGSDAASGQEPAADESTPEAPVAEDRPNRLRLSRSAAETATGAVYSSSRSTLRSRKRIVRPPRAATGEADSRPPAERASEPAVAAEPSAPAPAPAPPDVPDPEGGEGSEAAARRGRAPRRSAKSKGLPEGWVIDEEGFVVPGNG